MKLRVRVGLNIQDLRRARGLSQEALAHAAKMDRGYIGTLEHAHHGATLDMLERIAAVLEVDPAELLKPR